MNRYHSLILATVAISAVAFGQPAGGISNPGDAFDAYQVNYAANLNVGDSQINFTNTGYFGGFITTAPATAAAGNICVNTYVFDPQEEEIGCCACLVTPNGLMSLSAQADLISNNLTPAVPTSIVVKLLSSQPTGTTLTTCNPATVSAAALAGGGPGITGSTTANSLAPGMRAWMNTLEPGATAGTYEKVHSSFLPSILSEAERLALTTTCNFIQSNGTGYGICKSCRLGALGGSKQ